MLRYEPICQGTKTMMILENSLNNENFKKEFANLIQNYDKIKKAYENLMQIYV